MGSILAGKFVIGQLIGQGGFGNTYRAYDLKRNEIVAIKEFYPISFAQRSENGFTVSVTSQENTAAFNSGIEKFYNEARLVSRFNGNPNIVSVYEFFHENNTAYFTMEFLNGISLKSYIDMKGTLSPEQALYVLTEVSNALMIAHSADVLHRDISPDNIMLCEGGGLKLIDFGAARQVAANNPRGLSVILKEGFAPLEQYQKKGNQGPWTDIYSLGATIYYSLTGECMEDPMSRLESDKEFCSNKFGIEEQLWRVISRAVNLNIADRYRNAFELKEDIAKILYKPSPIIIEIKRPVLPQAAVPAAEAADLVQLAAAGTEKSRFSAKFMAVCGAAALAVIAGIVIAVGAVSGNNEDEIIEAGVQVEESVSEQTTTAKPKKERETEKVTTTAETTVPESSRDEETERPTTTSAKPKPKKPSPKTELTAVETSAAADTTATVTTTTAKKTETETTAAATTVKVTEPPVDDSKVKIGEKYYDIDTKVLNLMGQGLKNSDLKNVKKMTNLSEIIVSNNNLTDLSVLSGITSLEKITFHNNKVKDISFLKNLKNVTVVCADKNGISDLSPLSGLTKLEEFWAYGNNFTDISPLKNCKKLRCVNIGGSFIEDVSPLANGQALDHLNLSYNTVKDVDGYIASFSGLVLNPGAKLYISNCDPVLTEEEIIEIVYSVYCDDTFEYWY